MYRTFVLREMENGKLEGYIWDVEDPDRIVCIIHGIGEYGGRFDRVAEAFRKRGMAVVSMDLRGHGNSMGKQGHCAPRRDVIDDVTILLRYAMDRYPGKKIILYGHSMGGNIVLDYRYRGELNGLMAGYVASAPWIRLTRPVPRILYRTVKVISKIAPSITISSEVSEKDLGNLKSVRPYRENPMVHNRISALCAVDGFETGLMLEEGTLPDNGRAEDIPMLMMHGGDDRICSVEGTRRTYERLLNAGEPVEYIEWPGLRHEIHNGGGESTGDEVIERAASWIASR